jgi:hypothetical protein
MTTPADRAFPYFERGQEREEALGEFRLGLRALINPETGVTFTEDEVKRATQPGSRFWIELDAYDIIGQAKQGRGLFLADQIRLGRASHQWLVGYHDELWGERFLEASPGAGQVRALATAGTNFIGSTTIPDPAATTGRDPAGNQYQVFTTVVTPGNGEAVLDLVGVDTGVKTNITVGTEIRWDNPPLGAQPTAEVITTDFRGGFDQENDADHQSRLRARIAHKPGAGNDAHFRGWAREASNAVLDAYVYATAMHAGSTLVCITQKRGGTLGPLALKATDALLTIVRAYITPPTASVVPGRAFTLVTTFQERTAEVLVKLTQPKGNAAGWSDASPWPGFSSISASIQTVTDQTHFRMRSDTALPGGATSLTAPNAPHLMWWNELTSRFESLVVTSVTFVSGSNYDVVLQSPTTTGTLSPGDLISPDMARRQTLSIALEQYFDALGPGEAIESTDHRFDRCARFPEPAEEAPYRGGQSVITAISDALGGPLSNALLVSMTPTAPGVPIDPADGPFKLTLGPTGVYEEP